MLDSSQNIETTCKPKLNLAELKDVSVKKLKKKTRKTRNRKKNQEKLRNKKQKQKQKLLEKQKTIPRL